MNFLQQSNIFEGEGRDIQMLKKIDKVSENLMQEKLF